MTRDHGDYLTDILGAIDETASFVADMSIDAFRQDRKTANAVVRSLEVLGEAAKHIPDRLRDRAPNVPWKRIVGMRDKLIHGYFGVDLDIVWTVVKEELPPLRTDIARLLAQVESGEDEG